MPGDTGVNSAEGGMGNREGRGFPGSGKQLCPGVSAMGLLQGPGQGSTLAPVVCSNLQGWPTAYCPSCLGSCAPWALHSVARCGLPASRDLPHLVGSWELGSGGSSTVQLARAEPWPHAGLARAPTSRLGSQSLTLSLGLAESAQCEVFCLLARRPGLADSGCWGDWGPTGVSAPWAGP